MVKAKYLIYLIDFIGHPAMGDHYMNDARYQHLSEIIKHANVEECVILSTKINYNRFLEKFEKLVEYKNLADEYGWTWVELQAETQDTISVPEVVQYLKSKNISITHDTTIIFGGTNTSGCVFTTRPSSLVNWAQREYKTILHLGLSTDYHSTGLHPTEKESKAFAEIYQYLKKYDLVKNVDVVYHSNHIFE
jgi:hypothetical protein